MECRIGSAFWCNRKLACNIEVALLRLGFNRRLHHTRSKMEANSVTGILRWFLSVINDILTLHCRKPVIKHTTIDFAKHSVNTVTVLLGRL